MRENTGLSEQQPSVRAVSDIAQGPAARSVIGQEEGWRGVSDQQWRDAPVVSLSVRSHLVRGRCFGV